MWNDYNIQSKGAPKTNDSPSTSKMAMKKIRVAAISAKRSEQTKYTWRNPTTSQPTISMDLTKKILGELKLDYDVAEDLKKMKENITLFQLCKITQLRE